MDLSLSSSFEQILSQGYLWAFIAVFLGGILTSLTPCVYPMIAITVSLFGARESEPIWKRLTLSSIYVGGMALMYSCLGVIAALTGQVFGFLLTSPWVLGGLGIIFLLCAGSMFGLYNIYLPSSVSTSLSRVGGKGYLGALGMGLVAGVLAAPCTGPILYGILTWIGIKKSVLLGFSLLFVYSIGIGVLFWVVALGAASLPKAGSWMEGIKSIFGVVFLVCCLYILEKIFPIPLRLSSKSFGWIFLFIFMVLGGIGLGAIHLQFKSDSFFIKLRKGLGIFLLVVGLFGLVLWIKGPSLKEMKWLSFTEGILEASKEKKPLVMDFTSRWCEACDELDRKTFSHPKVREELERFVLIRVDSTRMTKKIEGIHKKYKIKGLPTVIILDSEGKERKRIMEFVLPSKFLEILSQIR
jgi:thiol:disulfide interchange protein DsbD